MSRKVLNVFRFQTEAKTFSISVILVLVKSSMKKDTKNNNLTATHKLWTRMFLSVMLWVILFLILLDIFTSSLSLHRKLKTPKKTIGSTNIKSKETNKSPSYGQIRSTFMFVLEPKLNMRSNKQIEKTS